MHAFTPLSGWRRKHWKVGTETPGKRCSNRRRSCSMTANLEVSEHSAETRSATSASRRLKMSRMTVGTWSVNSTRTVGEIFERTLGSDCRSPEKSNGSTSGKRQGERTPTKMHTVLVLVIGFGVLAASAFLGRLLGG